MCLPAKHGSSLPGPAVPDVYATTQASLTVCLRLRGRIAPACRRALVAVELSAGVYYQKCYDPECRHYRSHLMPLPTDVWHAYKHLAVAPPGGSAEQGPRQQQQVQAAAAAADEAEEDEECLTLLLQCERQQQQQAHTHHHHHQQQQQESQDHRQHQQQQQGPDHPGPCHQSCMAAGPAQHSTASASTPVPCDCDVGLQEDELCMQLLQDVEQQHMSQPRGVAVG